MGSNINKIIDIFFVIAIIILLYLYLTKSPKEIYVESIKHDTTYVTVEQPPIIIEKSPGKIKHTKYIYDTVVVNDSVFIYRDPEFVSKLDSVIQNDTVMISYYYPANLFDVNIRKKQDTLKYIYKEIMVSQKEEESIWTKSLYILGGLVIGYLIGK